MTNPGREVIRTRCRRGVSFDAHTVLALLNRLEAAERRADLAEVEADALIDRYALRGTSAKG